MGAILTVFLKEFRENLRERRTLLSAMILGPLLGPLLFAGGLSLSIERGTVKNDRPVSLAVAHTERAPNLLAFLHQYGVNIKPVGVDAEGARSAIREHRETLVLLITDHFGQKLGSGEPAPLELYADSSDASNGRDVTRVRILLEQYGALIARLRITARGVNPLVLSPVVLQNIDVSTPASRSVLVLGTLSYLMLLTMLMGGMYLAIDTTAGERERGSLESLLTVPVKRAHLIYGKILATCAYMTLSLILTVTAFAIALRFVGLEQFGMSLNFGPLVAVKVVLFSLPLVPLGAALMTIVAAFTRSYREAQTYLGLVLLIPTLPLVLASMLGLRPTARLMAVPSLSQHFLITSLLRDEPVSGGYLALSVTVTLAVGAALMLIAGRLYDREALLG
ncbi:MAG TPA: ABC transporter permease [Steroidobacteraceae bacterium]|nr:ABC transporter permease [Steroidobacteraceae bacterium]